jgi:Ca2+-binding RTX toxin-like protein
MASYVGTDGNDVFSIGTGVNNVDGKAGNDLLILNLASVVGDLDTFNSGGVITNHLDGADETSIGIGNIERVNITCGAGNDQLYLFGGDDTVNGGAGDDDINTRAGRAVVDGGSGFDIWRADLSALTEDGFLDLELNGKQAFLGGSVKAIESLQITLGSGDETVLTLTGERGRGTNDTIDGGAGDDVIRVGGGRDAAGGGDGEDLLIVDFSKAKGDIDTFNSGGVVTNHLTGLDEASVGIGGFEHIDMTTGKGADDIYLFNGDDTVSSGGGNDTINTRAGAAVVDGGAGIDSWEADLRAWTGGGTLDLSQAGIQAFYGGSVTGVESINLALGSGDDTVLTLTGKEGRGIGQTIDGGAGNDTFLVGGGRDAIGGGEGDDLLIIDFARAKGNISSIHSGAIVSNNLTGADEFTVYIGGVERIDITTGRGNDSLFTFGGADTLNGGRGADVMSGHGGDDTYYVDNKGDQVAESNGQGTDTVYASVSFSLESAYIENAILTGVGDNRLTGNLLANQLTGNDGDNLLTGAGGGDVLTGGKGADTFDYNALADSALATPDRIADLTGKDIIDLSGIDANTVKAGDQKFDLVDHFSGKAGELVLAFQSSEGVTYLEGDVNGDGTADLRIALDGDQHAFDHFVL